MRGFEDRRLRGETHRFDIPVRPRFESVLSTVAAATSEGRSSSRSLSISDFTDHVPRGHTVSAAAGTRGLSGISTPFLLFKLRSRGFNPANQSLTLLASSQPARLVLLILILLLKLVVYKENLDVLFVPSLGRRAAAAVERILRRVRRPRPHLGWSRVPSSLRVRWGGASSDGRGGGSRFAVLVHGADGETGAVEDGEHLLFRVAGPVDGVGRDDVLDTARPAQAVSRISGQLGSSSIRCCERQKRKPPDLRSVFVVRQEELQRREQSFASVA